MISTIRKRTCLLAGILLASLIPAIASNTLVPEGASFYAATAAPDRIVLTPSGDPARTAAVTWRTDSTCTATVAQIAPAGPSPALHLKARSVRGRMSVLSGGNGKAHHHQAEFRDLAPSTLYAYRVMGAGTWSEWFQFRTASDGPEPFSFLYFGDAQNAVKSHFSRVIRQAFQDLPRPAFLVHAGDLVNTRDGNTDDEWGEWFDAGGWITGMVPNIAAVGNHEYINVEGPGDKETYTLPASWNAQFTLPGNGPKELKGTVYYVDYQDMRIVVLNSLSALKHGTAAMQARWVESLLKNNPRRWTVAVYHHPMFSVSEGRDNPELRKHWQPLFDKYRVDLALQGHDHVYGRGTNAPEGKNHQDGKSGTVYVVSVAGPKMYRTSEAARAAMSRVGEDIQLYQIIHVDRSRLRFESRSADGMLYDGFELARQPDGSNRLIEATGGPARDCGRPGPKEGKRCWSVDDLEILPEAKK